MGLDIYLYKRTATPEEYTAREAIIELAEKASEKAWNKKLPGDAYKNATEDEKQEALAASRTAKEEVAAQHGITGLSKYGDIPSMEEEVNINSAKYPEHYFKVGYFRSSYNDSGINSALRRMGLEDLYWIMGYDRDKDAYDFYPDWSACKERAEQVLERLRKVEGGGLDIMRIDGGFGSLPKSPEEARERMLEQIRLHAGETSFRSYSNAYGHFYLDGLKVVGLMPGQSDGLFSGRPCMYVAFEKEGGNTWYEQALEIVMETCDYVLQQPDPSAYLVHWSS